MNKNTNILLVAILVALIGIGAILLRNQQCHNKYQFLSVRPGEVQSTIRQFQAEGWEFMSQKDDPMLGVVHVNFKRCK